MSALGCHRIFGFPTGESGGAEATLLLEVDMEIDFRAPTGGRLHRADGGGAIAAVLRKMGGSRSDLVHEGGDKLRLSSGAAQTEGFSTVRGSTHAWGAAREPADHDTLNHLGVVMPMRHHTVGVVNLRRAEGAIRA